jgi:hypothetical protein
MCSKRMISEKKFVGELQFYIPNSEADATHEVIILSRPDADLLRKEVVRRKSSVKALKDKMLAEMLEEMASAIEADSQRNTFVFCKKIVRSIYTVRQSTGPQRA